jgi:hypothetical protein
MDKPQSKVLLLGDAAVGKVPPCACLPACPCAPALTPDNTQTSLAIQLVHNAFLGTHPPPFYIIINIYSVTYFIYFFTHVYLFILFIY